MDARGWSPSIVAWLVVALAAPGGLAAQEPAPPQIRAIPGITADDPFPQACVSCHVVLPDGMDVRLSTLMTGWIAGVDSLLLAMAQSTALRGTTLTGRHPEPGTSLADIPAGCLSCHGGTATVAPSFARMMHRIHLTGGSTSVFLSMFQGECTYCHKLDMESGAWSIPSGPEP